MKAYGSGGMLKGEGMGKRPRSIQVDSAKQVFFQVEQEGHWVPAKASPVITEERLAPCVKQRLAAQAEAESGEQIGMMLVEQGYDYRTAHGVKRGNILRVYGRFGVKWSMIEETWRQS